MLKKYEIQEDSRLYLKKLNLEDGEKEYEFYSEIPSEENGFTNEVAGISKEDFLKEFLPRMLNYEKGIGLPEGFVPATSYFLWDGGEVVGLFRLRHSLTEVLRNGAGHIGYFTRASFRGKGYATRGLALMIEVAREIIKEEEIYLSVYKNNPASLAVQLANGAYIHHSDEEHHYTRIPLTAATQNHPLSEPGESGMKIPGEISPVSTTPEAVFGCGGEGQNLFRDTFMETERLAFSVWTKEDTALVELLWGDEAVTRYISASGRFAREEIAARLQTECRNLRETGVQYWPLFKKPTGEFLGCCGLRPYHKETGIYELGVHLKPDAWHQGYAAEAARKVMETAMEGQIPDLRSRTNSAPLASESSLRFLPPAAALFAGHNPNNTASAGLLKKLGFQYTHDEYYAPTGLMHPSYIYPAGELDGKNRK